LYLNFFGLKEQPFGVTPDPRFLYLSEAHKEALASLYYGIEANRGFIGLIARPGMGKTTMLFHLLESFRSSACIRRTRPGSVSRSSSRGASSI